MLKNHVLCHGKIAACVCVGVLTACTGSRESVLLQVHEAVVVVFEFFVVSVVQLSLILRSFGDELSLFLNQSGSLGQTLATMPGGFGEVFEWRSPSESCLFEGLDVGF